MGMPLRSAGILVEQIHHFKAVSIGIVKVGAASEEGPMAALLLLERYKP